MNTKKVKRVSKTSSRKVTNKSAAVKQKRKKQSVSASKRQSPSDSRPKKNAKKTSKQRKNLKPKKHQSKRKRQSNLKKLLLEIGITVLLSGGILFFVFQLLLAVPKVQGFAMSPNLQDGKRVVVYRKGEIRRYTNIYFTVPDRKDRLTNIRRVIGLPGETIKYENDVLYVNGEEKSEYFLVDHLADARENSYLLTENFSTEELLKETKGVIPEGYYLVLGDNRMFSVDSRSYGLVPADSIIGTIEMMF